MAWMVAAANALSWLFTYVWRAARTAAVKGTVAQMFMAINDRRANLELPQDGGDVGLIGQVGQDLQLGATEDKRVITITKDLSEKKRFISVLV